MSKQLLKDHTTEKLKEISEAITERMEELNISKTRLYLISGVLPNTIRTILKGDTTYSVNSLMNLLDALDLTMIIVDKE